MADQLFANGVKAGRNKACPCGSGKKYKKCCLSKDEEAEVEASGSAWDYQEAKKAIRSSQNYPVEKCLINGDWEKKGMANIIVIRRQEEDRYIFAGYLVDLFCLGVKDAFCNAGLSRRAVEEQLSHVMKRDSFQPIDLEYAKEIIYGAIDYAKKIGFDPHPDFKLAREVLGNAEATRRHKIRFGGPDGKPLLISGPDDDVDAILEKLSGREAL